MAVKQLKLNIAAEGQERQFYLAALEREIALYKIMRHKHIVGYIDMEQDTETGSLYVFLEYVSGGSIQSNYLCRALLTWLTFVVCWRDSDDSVSRW